jgi:hypothetical protein
VLERGQYAEQHGPAQTGADRAGSHETAEGIEIVERCNR